MLREIERFKPIGPRIEKADTIGADLEAARSLRIVNVGERSVRHQTEDAARRRKKRIDTDRHAPNNGVKVKPHLTVEFSMAASMTSAAALTRGGTAAYAALIMNMTALTLAISKAMRATTERCDADRELAAARTQLELVHSLDPELQKMLDRIRAGRPGAGAARPPLPSTLPDLPRTRTGPETDRGIGR